MAVDHFLRFLDGKLVSGIDGTSSCSVAALSIHFQYRALTLNDQFPCLGTRTTFTQGSYRFDLFHLIGTQETVRALGESLRRFVDIDIESLI
jgi:FPC/CPF motif-containing protein YcgG